MIWPLSNAEDFWSRVATIFPRSEADVEHLLVEPLLEALGYSREDIAPKYPVVFREGRRGRKPEADYVVFDGVVQDRTSSLLVVEVKAPGEDLNDAKEQGESYAYAVAVRAPVLLITDGVCLQVWQLQPTMESALVLQIEVRDLLARRAELEAILSKEVLRLYCRSLLHKRIGDVIGGFGPYLDAELVRVVALPRQVQRDIEGEDHAIRSSAALLIEFPTGAVLLAHSGFGKTRLAASVFRDALEERIQDSNRLLPFDLFLPDLINSEDLFRYLLDRVRPHQPAMTEAMLDSEFRIRGAVLVCDGFNRLPKEAIDQIASWLRHFRRDYPRSQVFVFSTEGWSPEVQLPKLVIKELSHRQQAAVVALVDPDAIHLLHDHSEEMDRIRAHPLLLTLLIKGRTARRGGRRTVLPLFEEWLGGIVRGQGDGLVIQGQREDALEAISVASVSSALTVRETTDLLASKAIPPTLLDDLHRRGGITVGAGGRVEVVHEALADFLRARVIARMSAPEGLDAIRALPLMRGSWLPILVLGQLRSRAGRDLLLSRALEADIRMYADLLAHPVATLDPDRLTPEERSSSLLRDVRVGADDLVERWFPALRSVIVRRLAGEDGGALALIGRHEGDWLDYTWSTVTQLGVEVAEEDPTSGDHYRSIRISGLGIGPEEGRLLGYRNVHETVEKSVLTRDLVGGMAWANERLASDLRVMFDGRGGPPPEDLEEIKALLAPETGKFVLTEDEKGRPYHLPINRMLEDAGRLAAAGQCQVDLWWKRLGAKRWMEPDDPAWPDLLHEHFRRSQLIYAEIAEASLRQLRPLLGFANAMPVRFHVRISPGRIRKAWMRVVWHPVPSWDLAGADTQYVADATEAGPDSRTHFETVQQELGRLGRPTDVSVWTESGIAPSFDGQTRSGAFDGGTSAVWEACQWIERDLERVLPRRGH